MLIYIIYLSNKIGNNENCHKLILTILIHKQSNLKDSTRREAAVSTTVQHTIDWSISEDANEITPVSV